MKTNKIISAILACSIMGTALAAPTAKWASATVNEKSVLINKSIDSPQVNNNREPVSFSYKLAADEKLNFEVQKNITSSRQYWLDSTAKILAKGINLPVSGGNTIIRISPLTNNKSVQLSAANIHILNNGIEKSLNVFADSKELNNTGLAFRDSSIALKVQSQAGHLNLKVDSNMGDTPFVIHVFEPESDYVLSLAATKMSFAANQKITINSDFLNANKNMQASLQGYISRPDGSVLGELNFIQDKKGGYSADLNAVGAQGLAHGLWEAHIFAKGIDKGVEIMRDAKIGFAVKLNTAAFDNSLNLTKNSIQLGINVGLAGRYEVRGVLMGTDPKSQQLQPIAMTMAANWLTAGSQSISLPLDRKFIAESQLVAPYAIRGIQLNNQTYFAPVQSVQQGIDLFEFELQDDQQIR